MRLKADPIVLLWIALLALPCCARTIRVSTVDALKSGTSALVPGGIAISDKQEGL